MESFGNNFVKSVKTLYKGEGHSGLKKQAGKILLGLAALSSVFGVVNALYSSKTPSKLNTSDVIDKNKKYVVD